MSGGGGGGGGYGSASDAVSCELLRFEAQLTSPKPAIVATVVVHEVLDIDVSVSGGVSVVQVLKGGLVVGGLTGPDASRLRTCIQEGHGYGAKVLSINGGQVRVRVEISP